MNMITYFLLQAKQFEGDGHHCLTDLLIKTSQLDEGDLDLGRIFDEEQSTWDLLNKKFGGDPEAPMSHYSVYSGIIPLYIRNELQIFLEMLINKQLINARAKPEELREQIKPYFRLFLQKRQEVGLPPISEEFLKNSFNHVYDRATGRSSQTPIFEDRRSEDRGTPDRRSRERMTGNLNKIRSLFYQPEISEEETYLSSALESLRGEVIPE